jgi:glycosyltransferase 2 family protein
MTTKGNSPQEQSAAPKAKNHRDWWIGLVLLLASLLLSIGVQIYLGGVSQFKSIIHLHWQAAAFLIFLLLLSWSFNGWRTKFLTYFMGVKISFGDGVLTTLAAEFAGVATPGSVGMPATYAFLFHNFGLDIGKAIGLVSIIVITDIAYFCSFMSLAMILEVFQKTWTEHAVYLVAVTAGVMLGAVILLVLLIFNYRRLFHVVGFIMSKFSWLARRRCYLTRGFVHFLQAVRALRQMSWFHLAALYGITVGFWAPRYLLLVVIIYFVGQTVPVFYLLLMQGVLNFGGQIFILPGGGGGVDAAYAAFLSPYLHEDAIAFTLLIWRTFTFYSLIIIGGPIFFWKAGAAAKRLLSRRG